MFNAHLLPLDKVAKAFGFATPPKVQLHLNVKSRKKQDLRAADMLKVSEAYNDQEAAKKKLADANRQWSR